MKIIFAGTPQFAATALEALLAQHFEVAAVLTQPDRPAGRGMKLVPGPVKQLAQARGLPVLQPASLKQPDIQRELAAIDADVMVVAAYGLILPQAVLQLPRHGCLNIHASLLPRWRGAAPIQRAMLAGDTETGITIMQMDAGLDTGDMLLKKSCPISALDTAQTLHDKLAPLGAEAIVAALRLLEQGRLAPVRQDGALATYAAKLTKEEAGVIWAEDAAHIARAVRAYNPFPVAHATFGETPVKILQASALDGTDGHGKVTTPENERSEVSSLRPNETRHARFPLSNFPPPACVVGASAPYNHGVPLAGAAGERANESLREFHFNGNPGVVLKVEKDGIVVACGKGALRLEMLQRPNAKAMPAAQFVQGFAVRPGDRFS